MAKKMTLAAYLAQRGKKAKALTKGEAALLGIPYPLQAGWPRRYGAIEIEEAMLEQLAACVEAARLAAEEKAARARAGTRTTAAPARSTQTTAKTKVVLGFVLRQARRYRSRRSAPWA